MSYLLNRRWSHAMLVVSIGVLLLLSFSQLVVAQSKAVTDMPMVDSTEIYQQDVITTTLQYSSTELTGPAINLSKIAIPSSNLQISNSLNITSTPVVTAPILPMLPIPAIATSFPLPTVRPAVEAATQTRSRFATADYKILLIAGIGFLLVAVVIAALLFRWLRHRKSESVVLPSETTNSPSGVTVLLDVTSAVSAMLQSVTQPDKQFQLTEAVTTIGRAADCTICIDESLLNWETTSRHHAEIRREGNAYVITDVSKRNGVYVEGQRTMKNLLRFGWRIGIGGVEFVFCDASVEQRTG